MLALPLINNFYTKVYWRVFWSYHKCLKSFVSEMFGRITVNRPLHWMPSVNLSSALTWTGTDLTNCVCKISVSPSANLFVMTCMLLICDGACSLPQLRATGMTLSSAHSLHISFLTKPKKLIDWLVIKHCLRIPEDETVIFFFILAWFLWVVTITL